MKVSQIFGSQITRSRKRVEKGFGILLLFLKNGKLHFLQMYQSDQSLGLVDLHSHSSHLTYNAEVITQIIE